MVLKGTWSPSYTISQVDDMGGGNRAEVYNQGQTLVLRQPRPGLHPLYFAVQGEQVHWDESEWRLTKRLRGLGVKKPKVIEVQGGMTVEILRGVIRLHSDPIIPPPNHQPVNAQTAQNEMERRLLRAVQNIYAGHGKGPVCVLLSGGVDSIAIAHALKRVGADVHAVTAGHSEEDFDPKWAKIAADHMEIPWTFIPIPKEGRELHSILVRTIATIEQTSFSNVLMGICCTAIQEWMVANDRPVAYLGFWGDLLFGHKLQVTGSFNQLPVEQQTDKAWTEQRITHCWHSKPHTLQLAKGLRKDGLTTWRVPFLHPNVADYAFGLPREFAPPKMDKPLLYGMMDKHIPYEKAAWNFKKKIGFYTGAGIGKTRLENPMLQDENIRRLYGELKKRLA